MRIVPVIDLKAGQVVRGIGGRRSEYRPIASRLTSSSEPLDVARALVENFQPAELYLADLDAIAGETPDWPVYRSLRTLGIELWVDAGVREGVDADKLAAAGIEGIVCGLETLRGPDVLCSIMDAIGPKRAIFSLDLRDGHLLGNLETWPVRHRDDPFVLVEFAIAKGIRRLIVLDMARVGEGRGVGSEELCRSIISAYPQLEVFAGGGVRNSSDISSMEKAGLAGALVASALHDGRIALIR